MINFKKIRVVLALFTFSLFVSLFLGTEKIQTTLSPVLRYFQFTPSLIDFLIPMVGLSIGFVFIVFLTFLFGRVYCSVLCPLGIAMDIFHRLSVRKGVKKNKHRFRYPWSKTRYSVFFLVFISLLTGSLSLLNLFDPYALFGRFLTDLLKPGQVYFQNYIVNQLASKKIYLFSPAIPFPYPSQTAIVTALISMLILFLAYRYGRIYCNMICPVGTFLGLISRYSLFGFHLDKTNCVKCRRCERVCKADCINSANFSVDSSRCTSCFNCVDTCPEKAIIYQLIKSDHISPNSSTEKRKLLKQGLFFLGGAFLLKFSAPVKLFGAFENNTPEYAIPPGSMNISHFTDKCIACHLCIDVCPTRVLRPSISAYIPKGIFQPIMNFKTGYCEHTCNLCGRVCPTGAIKTIVLDQKKKIKIGSAQLREDHCVVFKRHEKCSLCIENCPTKAITAKNVNGVNYPVLNPELCIGCGACEHVCPTQPKAFIVSANRYHKELELPKPSDNGIDESLEDFLKELE